LAIDFHSKGNRNSYAGRHVYPDWIAGIRRIADPAGKRVVDVGCGGGIYTAAWAKLGAAHVVGVDFSAEMVGAARETTRALTNVTIGLGDACRTGLPTGNADIVFERALIHHVRDKAACFREAYRLLTPGGLCILQNRTLADVSLPGTPEHLRGYFFEVFPRLLDVEAARRPNQEDVVRQLLDAGFTDVRTQSLSETRKEHDDVTSLAADLANRTGRSILHELSNGELERLVLHIAARLPAGIKVIERDQWTIWSARKPFAMAERDRAQM
jgi:ubiquinone/menaquinone biosynthesis C-methylase UbiE